MRLASLILSMMLIVSHAFADDGAASIAAGGLVLMKREPRIAMAKETLRISPSKVIVNYEFRNDSDQDVTTAVAFPVPAYTFGEDETVFGDSAFSDFQLLIGGVPAKFNVEVRAFVGQREVTALLKREHIDAATFGHWDEKMHDYSDPGADFTRASPASQRRLLAAGAFDKDSEPNWRVEKKYYWTQTFPSRRIVHIEHRYSPVLGGANSVGYGLLAEKDKPRKATRSEDEKDTIDEVNSLCLDAPLKVSLLRDSESGLMNSFNYVDFVLTTANTWKTPIEDFTLIVERPKINKPMTPSSSRTLISFCWLVRSTSWTLRTTRHTLQAFCREKNSALALFTSIAGSRELSPRFSSTPVQTQLPGLRHTQLTGLPEPQALGLGDKSLPTCVEDQSATRARSHWPAIAPSWSVACLVNRFRNGSR